MDYLYDGSFDGLLTCIYYNYYHQSADGIFRQDDYQPALMVDSMKVITDPCLAARVYTAVEEKISAGSLDTVYHVYLSSSPDKENLI
jgi:hypothetical protein